MNIANSLLNSYIDRYQSPRKTNSLANARLNRPSFVDEQRDAKEAEKAEALRRTKSLEQRQLSYRHENSHALSLQLKTRDGDVLTVDLSKLEAYSREKSNTTYQDDDVYYNEQSDSTSMYKSTEFNLGVMGELDEEEQEAIAEVLDQITDIADTFFAGDMKKAFESLGDMEYDSSEIAGFSFQLSQSSYTEVTRSYREVQEYTEEPAAMTPQKLGDVVMNLADTLAQAQSLLSNANDQMKSLLGHALDQHPANKQDTPAELQKAMLDKLVDSAEKLNELRQQADNNQLSLEDKEATI